MDEVTLFVESLSPETGRTRLCAKFGDRVLLIADNYSNVLTKQQRLKLLEEEIDAAKASLDELCEQRSKILMEER